MTTLHFHAMGSPCRIVVDGGPIDLPTQAHAELIRLESKWSRFLPDSEISHLNRNAGNITIVSSETFLLVSRAVEAHALTDGRFNPLMLHQLIGLGYDTSWHERGLSEPARTACPPDPASIEPVELYPEINAVRLPENTGFDGGGIGKGLAADLITDFLADRGATCSSVELGGDVRVNGDPWFGPNWSIGVADPFDDASDIAVFTPTSGAVATSSTLRRQWDTASGPHHHLLDPVTGQSAITDLVSVTACSTVTWWAEIAAKTALMAGTNDAISLLEQFGTPGLTVATDGTVRTTVGGAAAEATNHTASNHMNEMVMA